MIKKIILFSALLSTTIAFSSIAQSYENLVMVDIRNEKLLNFIKDFIKDNQKENGIYKLFVFSESSDNEGIYEIVFFSWWYPYSNDVASLAYTNIDNKIVLIYSGIEKFFPSDKRYQNQIKLIENRVERLFKEEEVPPTGINPAASIVVCGERVVYQANHRLELPNKYSCIREEPEEKR